MYEFHMGGRHVQGAHGHRAHLSTDGSHLDGAMIALMPTESDAKRLRLSGGEKAENLHLTLFLLGDEGASFSEDDRSSLVDRLSADLGGGPVSARVFGISRWNGDGEKPCWVYNIGDDRESDGSTLEDVRRSVAASLSSWASLTGTELPAQYTPWSAHVCVAYTKDLSLLRELETRLGPVTFDRVRVSFGPHDTDIPLNEAVTAAGPLRRNLTDLEVESRCDFAQMDNAWKEAVSSTLREWAGIQMDQRAQIREQITAAVDSNRPDDLSTITVSVDDAATLLAERMIEFALSAGRQQEKEARDQGVDIPEWTLPEENVLTSAAGRRVLRAIARTTASVLGGSLVSSAKRRAMALIGRGQSGEEVADQVDEGLSELTDAQPEESIGAAMTSAQNAGRFAVLAVAPPARTYVATEVLDKNSCSPCRKVDGTEYDTLSAAEASYPSGGYVDCLGGTRCRGSVVAVWDQGRTASASLTETLEERVPYQVENDHPDCPKESPYAVVRKGTGEVMGCHDSAESAQEQVAALSVSEDEGEYTSKVAPWEGVLVLEGVVTGDGREFAPGSLTWADLPIPLRWNKEDSHGGEPHTVAVNVGRIDKIWRDGSKIMGSGVLNLGDENGERAYSLLRGKFLRGVSIDADSISDADMEMIWSEGDAEGGEGDLFDLLFASPEKVIFHAGRIRAATLVDIPAFAEAYVSLTGEPVLASAADQVAFRHAFTAVASHSTATSDGPWDGPANEARLPSPMTVEQARNAYAWIDMDRVEDGKLPKDAGSFIHHEVSADGSPGAANLTACSSGIGILNGGRGGTNIPSSDVQGVYDHLARHLRDADREAPPLQAQAHVLVAHGASWTPPREYFTDPGLSFPTPITITADDRVYGHAALTGECHIGFDGVCITPPFEDFHSHFLTGSVLCSDGSTVAVGQITVGTSHAPLSMAAGPAAQHYDHTGWAVADVAVGNDEYGIWVSGAIRPGADPIRVHELRASGQVSGDWRRIGGQLRLVGLLAVNVPGYPVPKLSSLVSAGVQQSLVAAGHPGVGKRLSEEEQDKEAMQRVMRMLRAKVHGKE